MAKSRFLIPATLILFAAVSRFFPYLFPSHFSFNVQPVMAVALFGAASFQSRKAAFLIPLAAMLLSDWVLGMNRVTPFVYLGFLCTLGIGFWLKSRKTPLSILGAALSSSLIFFLVTNFGVFLLGELYPFNLQGFVQCYILAIPFLKNSIVGDLLFSILLFGGSALIGKIASSRSLKAIPVRSSRSVF